MTCLLAALPALAAAQAPQPTGGQLPLGPAPRMEDGNVTVLELRLNDLVVTDGIAAYEAGREVLLPLGELSRLLTIAIRTRPAEGTAEGFVLREDRSFHLDTRRGAVTIGGREEAYDRSLVRVLPDDLYVASSLVSRWLPLDFDVNLSSLVLRVRPREQLPLQARLERGRAGARAGWRDGEQDRGYPRQDIPYSMLGVPYVDQTFTVGVTGGRGRRTSSTYSAYLTGDIAGMEGAAYVNSTKDKPNPDIRFSLGRHDPDAGLLGPLHARTALFGSSVSAPNVPHIATRTGVGDGHGLLVSSRPITQPTSFDRHTLEGDLPPGWDVELFYNDALIGFQASRPDGRYRFEDRPLAYGRNEFRLVFHGPLGQQRVERQVFDLEQSTMRPGEFFYTAGHHQDDAGRARAVSQFEWGLTRSLNAEAGLVRLPGIGTTGAGGIYSYGGLRAYAAPFILGTQLVRAPNGGWLNESVVKTRLDLTAVTYSHVQTHDFASEAYLPSLDPLRTRDTVRLDGNIPAGGLPPLPYSLEVLREAFESGRKTTGTAARLSAFLKGTSVTSQVRWLSVDGHALASGSTQVSRRIGALGLSAQVAYTLKPHGSIDLVALASEQRLASGYLLNLGLSRTLGEHGETIGTAALNRDFGRFGLGITASRSSTGAYSAGLQLFVAIGQDPRTGRWRFDARPRADTGTASVRVYLDHNGNRRFDEGDEPVQNAAMMVNGSRTPVRTDAEGLAWLDRLPVHQHVDVAADAQTLEDPMWQPDVAGLRVVPRPGTVAKLDFPVVATTEVEGSVYLVDGSRSRGIGNAMVEVVDAQGRVVASTRSSWDGYYVIEGIKQGTYLVRVAPSQLGPLGLQDPGVRSVTTRADGQLVSGIDFVLQRPAPAPQPAGPPQDPATGPGDRP